MLQPPLRCRLALRIRLVCVVIFVIGAMLPPYIPKDALAQGNEDLPADSPQFLLVEDGFLMKSSSLTRQGSRRAYAEGLIHTVKDGESLQRIGDRYHIKPDTIRWANSLPDNATIKPGQQLVILPVDGVLHTVTRGQTLLRIAELYSISPAAIASQNKVEWGFILAGQELYIH